ncbi:MAG: FtsX-like permease family protein [Faecousia sp.]
MRRNLRQSIIKSLGRYIAIAAIIALGAGIFVGLLMTKADMVTTGQEYMDEQKMFDIRLISTYGWDREQVQDAAGLTGIAQAEGIYYKDLIARYGNEGEDKVYRFYTLPEDLNQVVLQGGRMPENINECLVDGFHADDSVLGSKILLSSTNDKDDLEDMKLYLYTVVGYVSSPLYMDMNRGTTAVGSGILEGYIYLPRDSVNADYVTEIHLKLPGNHQVYSEAYQDLLDDTIDAIEPAAEQMGRERFDAVKAEAEEEYKDGYKEYLDGLKDYEEGKAEVEKELADALQELKDGEQEIQDTYKDLQNAERKLYNAKKEIADGYKQLDEGREALMEAKKLAQIQKPVLDAGKAALEAATGKSFSELTEIVSSGPGKIKEMERQIQQLDEAIAQEEDEEKRNELIAKKIELQASIAQINAILVYSSQIQAIADGYAGLAELEAQEQTLIETEKKLKESEKKVKKNITEVYNGYEELEEAKADIAEGWVEYYDGKAEAEQELADAKQELDDAKIDLEEARKDIDSMDEPDVIILDRGSNVGYNNLDSSSDIVQGVARVFPLFFLLIAALVCITTMTRMIEEERTQIGTLKALGYSNAAIISKYLFYAGSSALVGCGLGIAAGSTIFPMIIWEAYKIMLHVKPNVVLTINWPLSITVIVVYTVVILAVTWYCCHRTLEEVPAELIRPRAPEAGKALLVEKLPFWKKVSFLNKVTIRNIFRYRQRLAMMLVGIGGCTALLVTGFGLRDSIVNVVDYQFQEVTQYDLSIYFRNDLTQDTKEEFLEILEPGMNSMFYHQSSMELEFDNRTKELYMIAAGEELPSFIHFHKGDQEVSMPGLNEVVLSVGVAEAMGIDVGDTVTMRDPDLKQLELTVSGIYDNHVDNYSIVLPETLEAQWGSTPQQQMAFVQLSEGMDVHGIGAEIADLKSVMNVSVSVDMAETVQKMMSALDLVIIVIVFCAGLLAVTVLYNLTNININERIREIATIKVLGFNAKETSSYVFKENMTLTVVGSVLGLGLGYALLVFVISQIKIDMVWFKPLVLPASYVYAIVLTILAALAVNFIFYFKLQKINMAEALKSVE